MKRLGPALLVIAVAAASALFVATPATAQRLINGRLRMGDANTPVRVNGALEVNAPVYPLDTTNGVFIDAGAVATPALTVIGLTTLNGSISAVSTTLAGTCTLGGQSPATCTATVRSGCRPFCTIQGGSAAIATKGVACAVSATTLTATSQNAATEVVSYLCL